jgi:hypothetical protein
VPLWTLALLVPLLDVEWDAPGGCPGEAAFVQAVESEVDLAAQGDLPVLMARITIVELADGRWRLTMVLASEDRSDERTFEDDSCEAVVETAAAVVSLRVIELVRTSAIVPDPSAIPRPEPPPEEPTAPARVEPVQREPANSEASSLFEANEHWDAPAASPEPRQHIRAGTPVGGWLALQGGLAVGVAPGIGGAVGLEGGITGARWRVGVALHGAPVRRREHPQDGAVRGRFDLVTAQVLGCGVPSAGPVLFPLCGRLAAGAIHGVGEGAIDRPEPSWSPWVGLGGTAGAAWRATRWLAPFVSAELLATLRGSSFSVGSLPGTLHETGPVAFRAWAGLEFHLKIGPQ